MYPHESVFQFKQFNVKQNKCAMKIGTDGVLLGAWTKVEDAKSILDVGTGTGLIALMVAQKSNILIDALDIDINSFEQSKENFETSPWKDRLNCFKIAIQDYSRNTNKRYDLIVSNPPYFINSPKSNIDARATARHMDESLSPEDLVNAVYILLKENGRFNVILPLREGNLFTTIAEKSGLFCNRLVRVYTKPDKTEKRLLMTFGKTRTTVETDKLYIQNENGEYSKEFIALTSPYYTHLPGLPNL
ncbi:MAG TPA: methyltransferase [Bacteroidia bacterium]|nr:methyltransferase [Bacteroidia bacterium]HNU34041.1 methyltransferase [Bacteroidia bacterium]